MSDSDSSSDNLVVDIPTNPQIAVADQAGVSDSTTDNADLIERPTLDLLYRHITPFNGDRSQLSSFLINCNNAFFLAQPNQKQTLLLYIISKLSAEVKTCINISTIRSWTELRASLKRTYGTLENSTQLLQELETSYQKSNESVKEFFLRLENTKVKCLKIVTDENLVPSELCGKLAMINETALRRFCLFSKDEISRVLRQKEHLTDLNQAYHFAIVEEQALSLRKLTFHNSGPSTSHKRYHQPQRCTICRRTNHDANHCKFRDNPSNNNSREPNPRFNNNTEYQSKKCEYCKRLGHTINECYTKQSNERRNSQFHPNPRVGMTLNSQEPTVNNAPLSVQGLSEAFCMVKML